MSKKLYYFNSKGFHVKAYDNKTALLKNVLNTVMDPHPPGDLKSVTGRFRSARRFDTD